MAVNMEIAEIIAFRRWMLMTNPILIDQNTQTVTMSTGSIFMATFMPISGILDQDPSECVHLRRPLPVMATNGTIDLPNKNYQALGALMCP